MPDEFAVNNVHVAQQPRFERDGTISKMTVVRYYVGTHGPFSLDYKSTDYTPEKLNGDLINHVRELRTLMMGLPK